MWHREFFSRAPKHVVPASPGDWTAVDWAVAEAKFPVASGGTIER